MTRTDWTKISHYLIDDIQDVVIWAHKNNVSDHNLRDLPRLINANSPVFGMKCVTAMTDLASAHEELMSPYIKRLITQILVFFDPNNTEPYARDRQVEAIKKANANTGRTSMRISISIPDDLVGWWGELTPVERGDWIAKVVKSE